MADIEISNDKYINANDFIQKCKQDYYDKAVDFDFLITELAEMPKVDVVEVVRCKDCKHCESVQSWKDFNLGCMLRREFTTPNDYCSQAERKETNG